MQNDLHIEIARLRRRVEELEAELEWYKEDASIPFKKIVVTNLGVTKLLAPVVELFLTRTFVRRSSLAVIGDSKGWTDPDKFGAIAVCRLRQGLHGTGVKIQTVWGQGYSIDKESQQELRRLVYGDEG